MHSRIATDSDIDGILDLQKVYLHSELDKEERKKGFVTTPFTHEQIKDIIGKSGLFLCEDHTKIIAYVFAGTWDYYDQWPIFRYMTSRFPRLSFKNFEVATSATFQYGPVCVDMAYRGKKVFNILFEEMRLHWMEKFPLAVTFINAINEVSTRAHSKIGWEEIDQFDYNGNHYLTMAFDMKHSVI
ncbi:MAG: GNAT family acetyltransferase [Cyclobacteriaceae bacterium]